MTGPFASCLLALPFAVGLSLAVPTSVSAQMGLNPVVKIPVQLTDARQINPTTVELKYADAAPVEAADDQQCERDSVKHFLSSFTLRIF